MNIEAKITGLSYEPKLCRKLRTYQFIDLNKALKTDGTFKIEIEDQEIAVSWWVSAKRTRSYPYARVYDSLDFSGKKVTIIPIFKDEGADGDRDYLQWDTISLMSLLQVNVIISYYVEAEKNENYDNKITNQTFNIKQIKEKIKELLKYKSDPLHWNLKQVQDIGEIGKKAIAAYKKISSKTGVKMHSLSRAQRRIDKLKKGKDEFLKLSRGLAREAQMRELVTDQPKEQLNGEKATITISNYLGGLYYFTVDEVELRDENLYLIEGKHTSLATLPSLNDIKDGLLKMILYTNLENVKIEENVINFVPVIKLTTNNKFEFSTLSKRKKKDLEDLLNEAQENNFKVIINQNFVDSSITED
jgi:hypothetical protein